MGSPVDAYNLQELLNTDVRTELPVQAVTSVTSQPPFITVPGVYNVRDLGSASVRPGFAYRSAVVNGIWDEGKIILRDLGVGTIFDLRNPKERAKQPSPVVEGVDIIWEPYARDPLPTNLSDFGGDDDGVSGFVGMYTHILEILTPTFRKVFEHIRDRPDQPFLFHCSAGKDRTGVLAALIFLLVETPSEAIVHDYLLTRVGVEPFRDAMLGPFLRASGAASLDNPGLRNICSVRAGAMVAFIAALDEKFGGARGYLTDELGFPQKDVDTITGHLKRKPEPNDGTPIRN